jgi:formylmethanofuran dehydrogenase subunit C
LALEPSVNHQKCAHYHQGKIMDYDIINGEKFPQTIVAEDFELLDTHNGTIKVHGGCFKLHGTLKGTLSIASQDMAEIHGTQQGTVSLSSNSSLLVTGKIQGTTSVPQGATVVVEETGKLQGTLSNNGTVILRGTLAGAQSGDGELIIEGNGYIKEPVVKNGINYY